MTRISASAKNGVSQTMNSKQRASTGATSQSVSATTLAPRGPGVDQRHLAKDVPLLDRFQQLIADRDLRSTGGQDEHAVTIITLFKNHVTGLLSDPLGRCRDQPRKVLVLGHRSLRPLRTKPIGCLFRIRTMPDVCTERPSGIVVAAPDNAALLMADCAAFQRVRQVGEI
jgi:hypothetical protein